jgi:hypothetical protein
MTLCDSVWWETSKGKKFEAEDRLCVHGLELEHTEEELNQFLAQASSQVIQILYAARFTHNGDGIYTSLFNISVLLDYSWDKMRTILRPLRELLGESKTGLQELFIAASNPILTRKLSSGSSLRDLANGCMQRIKKISASQLPKCFG